MMKIRSQLVFTTGFLFAASTLGLSSCSSGPEVHRSNYASLSQQKFFESSFEDVWRAIDRSFENYKILERDPAKVTPTELRNLKKRSLETDWIYGESRDKYHTFTFANRAPIKKALQTRLKYTVLAEAKFPGVVVTVTSKEEIEMLKEDGSSRGWDDVSDDERDSSRGAEVLAKIEIALHSAPNL